MTAVAPPVPQQKHSTRRAVLASTVGSVIEWYDFSLYGVVAALVFPAVFFPSADPFTGTLLTFSTFFVGFIARPVGAILFGHLGDRHGRKSVLIATILVMGIGTVGIGLLPGYDTIGVWAPVLLVLLRIMQGIGAGGEWGGAILLASESGRKGSSGFLTSFPQSAAMIGISLATLVVLIASSSAGASDAFAEGLWRVPFLISTVLIGLGFWMRRGIGETGEFLAVRASKAQVRRPIIEVLKTYPKEIVLALLVKSGEMAAVYLFTSFVYTYGTKVGGFERGYLLSLVAIAAILSAVLMPFAGRLGDRIGALKVYLIGAVGMAAVCAFYFSAIASGDPVVAGVTILVSLLPYSFMFASEATILTSLFPAHLRYSGSSLAFNLAGIIGGGPAPTIAVAILAATAAPFALSAYLLVTVGLGILAAVALMRRTRRPQDPSDTKANVDRVLL